MVSNVVQPHRWHGINVCERGEMKKMVAWVAIDKCR